MSKNVLFLCKKLLIANFPQTPIGLQWLEALFSNPTSSHTPTISAFYSIFSWIYDPIHRVQFCSCFIVRSQES